jgi:hypothetical protein
MSQVLQVVKRLAGFFEDNKASPLRRESPQEDSWGDVGDLTLRFLSFSASEICTSGRGLLWRSVIVDFEEILDTVTLGDYLLGLNALGFGFDGEEVLLIIEERRPEGLLLL